MSPPAWSPRHALTVLLPQPGWHCGAWGGLAETGGWGHSEAAADGGHISALVGMGRSWEPRLTVPELVLCATRWRWGPARHHARRWSWAPAWVLFPSTSHGSALLPDVGSAPSAALGAWRSDPALVYDTIHVPLPYFATLCRASNMALQPMLPPAHLHAACRSPPLQLGDWDTVLIHSISASPRPPLGDLPCPMGTYAAPVLPACAARKPSLPHLATGRCS